MFKLIEINRTETFPDEVRNTTDDYLKAVLELIINLPSINDGYSKGGFIFATCLICTIFSVFIKENKLCVQLVSKFISSHIFHIFFGFVVGKLDYHVISRGLKEDNENQINVTTNFLSGIRIPILLYSCYSCYHIYFFKQLPYIIAYGILGKTVFITLAGVLIKASSETFLEYNMAYCQAITFSSCLAIVDPLSAFSVFKDTSQRNFYLLLGIYTLGNGMTVEVFDAGLILSPYPIKFKFPVSTYMFLVLKVLISLTMSVLVGFIIGLATSFLSRWTRNDPDCEYYEPFITIAGPLLTYFLNDLFGHSAIFGPIVCCITQERYVFMNMTPRSVTSIKLILEALSYLSNLLCFVIVGYQFSFVMFNSSIWFTIMTLVISYAVKGIIIITITLIINYNQTRPIGTRLQALLTFGGVRGPRSYFMIVLYENAPFSKLFHQTQLHLIVFSVIVDTLISKLLVRSIRRKLESRKDKHVTMIPLPHEWEETVDGCMNSLVKLEEKFQAFLVSKKEESSEQETDGAELRQETLNTKKGNENRNNN